MTGAIPAAYSEFISSTAERLCDLVNEHADRDPQASPLSDAMRILEIVAGGVIAADFPLEEAEVDRLIDDLCDRLKRNMREWRALRGGGSRA